MNNNNNNNSNFPTPLPGVWRTGVRATGHAHSPPDIDSYEVPVVYRSSRSFQPSHDDWSGALDARRMVGDRRPSGLYTIPDFLGQPVRRPQGIYIINGAIGSGMNPRFRGTVHRSPPRSRGQTNMQAPAEAQNSRSTATSKLKKEVYNPKQQTWRPSLYYKSNGAASANNSKVQDEDGKRCAVCLEDFEPKEEVMLTPCKHMFHESCIVPWVTSNGQCPVCRFVICEREREREGENPSPPFIINNIANTTPSEILAGELFSILRAMEEAFQLRNAAY